MATATRKQTTKALFSDPFQAGYQAAQSLAGAVEAPRVVEDPQAPSVDVQAVQKALKDFYAANEESKRLAVVLRELRKIIDTLPEGVYNDYRIRWVPNSDRKEIDEDQIRALYVALVRDVPMRIKPIKPSLKVEKL
jgi:hypothetical protein